MKFILEKTDALTSARAGKIETAHGIIETPIFMPVGTVGSVKGIHFRELENDVGAQIILGNTYHLYLRPGLEIIQKAGGLHRFIGWNKPILTDSGGYQVFSLSDIRKIKEEGVQFASHIDGSRYLFTPENVVDIQRTIGADIMMAFDECAPYPCDYKYARKSMELTHRWLDRGIKQFLNTVPLYDYEQSFFPIVQGSVYKDLRIASAEKIASCEMDGNAIGGLSVGEPAELMYEMIDTVTQVLPVNKPRYLMGVGTPANILEAIALGIDMFDCVLPTRNGRNGMLFTPYGIMNMRNEKWKKDFRPLDEHSECYIDRVCSRAYLRHLFVAKEMLAAQIATLHNLHFYLWLVKEARKNIINGTFASWKENMMLNLSKRL